MDCQVPHQPWLPPLSQRDIHLNRRKVNEDLFAPDSRLVCPNIGFRSNGSFEVIKPNGSANQPLLMNLAEHHTLPLPIFPPSSIKCGRGIWNWTSFIWIFNVFTQIIHSRSSLIWCQTSAGQSDALWRELSSWVPTANGKQQRWVIIKFKVKHS